MEGNQSFGNLINGNKPVVVDFFAEWCGPCKMMPPILKELKDMVGDSATIIKIDVDKNPNVAAAYNIKGVPTIMIFKNGKVMYRQSGVVPARQLKMAVDQAVLYRQGNALSVRGIP